MTDKIILDDLPDDVQATIESRNRALAALGTAAGGLEFLVSRMQRWLPGSTVRVAFLGGSTALHKKIADVAGTIDDFCNLTLDFGYDQATGAFRVWSENDEDYAAEIRVSFDQRGYFSLVGTDAIAENVGQPDRPVGGRPYQRTLNLGAFHVQPPATWKGTVLHEFLHALGFEHEHSNFLGPCQEAFRWEDDPGYVPTDQDGVFVTDAAGRRPGIYTYLAGEPNVWSRAKVDANLRSVTGPGIEASAFDRRSVMLYRFPALFYRTPNSDCAPASDGQSLSEGDRGGLRSLYPEAEAEVAAVIAAKRGILEGLQAAGNGGGQGPQPAIAAVASLAAAAPPMSSDALRAAIGCLSRQLSKHL